MRNGFGWSRMLALVVLSMSILVGAASTASGYPAGSEEFGSRNERTFCTIATRLAPQLRKESDLRAACAPSARIIVEVPDVRQPAPIPATGSPVRALLLWLAVALALVAAVSMKSIRAYLGTAATPTSGR